MISMSNAIQERTFAGAHYAIASKTAVQAARVNDNQLIKAGFSEKCRQTIYNNSEVMCFVHSKNPLNDFIRIIKHLQEGYPKFCRTTKRVIAGTIVGSLPKWLDTKKQGIENGESHLAQNQSGVYHIRNCESTTYDPRKHHYTQLGDK